jgi:formylglycine-generating enzyme required for sulfatase activity
MLIAGKSSQAVEATMMPEPTASFDVEDIEPSVIIPKGAFEMGMNEGEIDGLLQENPDWTRKILIDGLPKHTVTLKAYSIDKTEVTNKMFMRFISDTIYTTEAESEGFGLVFTGQNWSVIESADWAHPRGPDSTIEGMENFPVVQVTWRDAAAYCSWAGRHLPTEAQWEKAARGTDGRIFPWGNKAPAGDLLNFADKHTPFPWSTTTVDDGWLYATNVGSFPKGASPYGVLDMAGNVYEWVADWYDPTYYSTSPAENPVGPKSGIKRSKRGGAWGIRILAARSDYRDAFYPSYRGDDMGFRCAK